MLTPKRHQLILDFIDKHNTVTIQDLVELTDASESTIRRDLSELERLEKIERVHGGATLKHSKNQELSFPEKATKYIDEKKGIAKCAASFVEPNECIYLDAGTTTFEMIPYLAQQNVIVVTNGLTHLEALGRYEISTYLLGGFVKHNTRALIGSGAISSLNNYRFDKCFLGVNGVHEHYGYTTPDPEEAMIKRSVLELAQQQFVLADHTKLNTISFANIADIHQATMITNEKVDVDVTPFQNKTSVKVVSL
ncbi:DeoR family transcriptional regulator [Aquibacillus albus]|uniref:DeoR family fructose operon transcriptional repressor n=1 Tax=Aquibacillus albus TaxID=1168171 RepID=A0ABS2MYR8_9BACI|nr:DeoR family fructose operon transcriptional repressor [Aquibacillus albus]